MSAQIGLGLLLTVASASLIDWGYLTEHAAASPLPPLRARRPVRSLRPLPGSRRWLLGFASESAGFALYVVARALAPLALVQAVAAGGIGILALLVARSRLARRRFRERRGRRLGRNRHRLISSPTPLGAVSGSEKGFAPRIVLILCGRGRLSV